jgi:trehalose-6-phosphatase
MAIMLLRALLIQETILKYIISGLSMADCRIRFGCPSMDA